MKSATLHIVVFSPTNTSRRIAEAFSRGFAPQQSRMTVVTLRDAVPVTLPHDETVLFAVPVYGGRVAPTALKRMEQIRGTQTPAVLIVLYGNRSFGNALRELSDFVAARGFTPVAAGAFIGEHSYSTEQSPIAPGRPDSQDLSEAESFGKKITEQISVTDTFVPLDLRRLSTPASGLLSLLRFVWFASGYIRRQKKHPVVRIPITDAARCTGCGLCAEQCPTQAIAPGDELHTDPARCIRCCACVKGCPELARTYETPFAAVLSRDFSRPKPNVFLP